MKRENLRKVQVFEYDFDKENYRVIEKIVFQGYFHKYVERPRSITAIIEQEDGRLKEVYISDFRFLD